MSNKSNSLIDMLELPEKVRRITRLTTLSEFPYGELQKNQLGELAQDMKNLLNIELNFTIIVCHYDGSFQCVFTNLYEMTVLRQLWMEWAGNYIIILPNIVKTDMFYGLETDDELIKFALINNKNLFLKSCDGYELFHLYLGK